VQKEVDNITSAAAQQLCAYKEAVIKKEKVLEDKSQQLLSLRPRRNELIKQKN